MQWYLDFYLDVLADVLLLMCAGDCSDCDMASGIGQCCAAHGNCFPVLRDRLEDAVTTAAQATQYVLMSWLLH